MFRLVRINKFFVAEGVSRGLEFLNNKCSAMNRAKNKKDRKSDLDKQER
jgi:hypothetical protein